MIGSDELADPLKITEVVIKQEPDTETEGGAATILSQLNQLPLVVVEKSKTLDTLARDIASGQKPSKGIIRITDTLARCGQCNTVFESYKLAKVHYLTVHKKLNVCSVCLMATKNPVEFRVHLLAHAGLMKCKLCNKDFKTLLALKAHFSTHTKSLICKVCCVSFNSPQKLRKHQIKAHKPNTL
jgi:hypothetical protein